MKNRVEILLVDDSSIDAELIIRALKKNDLTPKILHLKDGAVALDFIFAKGDYSDRKIEDFPRVVLLDLKMPKLNGMEVLQKIREDQRTKTIPVVVFTSSKESPDIKKCYDLGVNSYVVKPIAFDQFQKAISELRSYWMIVNETLQ